MVGKFDLKKEYKNLYTSKQKPILINVTSNIKNIMKFIY